MKHVAVIGATGGIGQALVRGLLDSASIETVLTFSRSTLSLSHHKLHKHSIDILSEDSVRSAANTLSGHPSLDGLLISTGILHQDSVRPEKTIKQFNLESCQNVMALNTIAPLLVVRSFLPFLDKEADTKIGILSARVGSISDNRLGGWYSYRASKAALNMLIKTTSIELKRTHPKLTLIGLHPGTVDTGLSAPFQANAKQLLSPQDSASQLLTVVENSSPADSGKIWDYKGIEVPA